MTQEVKVTIQLTLECDVTLLKGDIDDRVKSAIILDGDLIDIITIDTIEIKEEAELYDTENIER